MGRTPPRGLRGLRKNDQTLGECECSMRQDFKGRKNKSSSFLVRDNHKNGKTGRFYFMHLATNKGRDRYQYTNCNGTCERTREGGDIEKEKNNEHVENCRATPPRAQTVLTNE